ncbi:snake venom 5'-nucleotidase-like isoform X2 [Acipenser ruthenus]|uniref:snake venom 5'-nucleotidase-like isoform X2 n=1 Tax=Acipenser ruthenus TaxID=7906 RepID=UPI002740986B|nr:snake venom 5'-nucleotidase-like isoform X2 [Acipenser ruthenus]
MGVSGEKLRLVLLLELLFTSYFAACFDVTLLHTNDVHARVEETSVYSGKCDPGGECYAGVARRLTKINSIRKTEENVLLLDAGDQYQGTIWFNYYKGDEAAHFMNRLKYDAMALGNHEFDNGMEGLISPFLQKVNCSVLSANMKPDQELADKISGLVLPYKIFTLGSEKVAVVGYTTKETPTLSTPGPHVVFQDEVQALQVEVDKLKTLGINKIIALGHSGFETDKLIAKKVSGVDVVIGGHSNTFLYTGTPPSNDVPAGQYPFMVDSDDGRKVPVVQAYAFGKYLGYLKVTFNKEGNVVAAKGNPILLDRTITEDKELRAEVDLWKQKLSNYSAQVIGKTMVYLNGTTQECRFRECNMGNLICDAAINHNIKFPDELRWNHVSLCIINGGSIRAPIRTITLETLTAVMPFDGTFDLIELKGSTLRAAFEHSVRRHGQSTGEFLQVSGIRVVFDLSKAPGHRVKKLDVLCTKCRVPYYEPLDINKTYKVVIPSYVAGGGDGFAMIKEEKLKHDTGDQDISVVSEYISAMKKVYPAVEGRILFSGSVPTGLLSKAHLKMVLLSLAFFLASIV